MKATLNLNFGRLCLVAMLICNNSFRACGHDLPQPRGSTHEATITCFYACSHDIDTYTSLAQRHQIENRARTVLNNSQAFAALPFSNTLAPWRHAAQALWPTLSKSATTLSSAWERMHAALPSDHSSIDDKFAIAFPEPGLAPRPRLKSPTPQAIALAQFLNQVEETQCQVSQALSNQADLHRLVANHAQQLTNLLNTSLAKLSTSPTAHQPPGPQFVIFDTLTGGHILLTVAQAQQWQFAVPIEKLTEKLTAAKTSTVNLLSSYAAPIRQQAVTAVSEHLKLAAGALLELSHSVAKLAPTQVAKRNAMRQWE